MTSLPYDIEDLCAEFIEAEVGRHDWRKNWAKMREEQDMVEHAKIWAARYSYVVDPAELVTWIDDYVRKTRGRWS